MAAVLRGAVHWADLNPVKGHEQAGVRPVLVLSHDVFNERSGTVIAMAITSREQGVGFPLAYGLKDRVQARKAWVKISQVRTLARERIGRRIGQVSVEELEDIVEGLNEIISG